MNPNWDLEWKSVFFHYSRVSVSSKVSRCYFPSCLVYYCSWSHFQGGHLGPISIRKKVSSVWLLIETSNTINISERYSRPAKRAIPCGEEENKEERRRSMRPLPRGKVARPRSLPTPSRHRKRATGRREKTNELPNFLIKSQLISIHPLYNYNLQTELQSEVLFASKRTVVSERRLIILDINRT